MSSVFIKLSTIVAISMDVKWRAVRHSVRRNNKIVQGLEYSRVMIDDRPKLPNCWVFTTCTTNTNVHVRVTRDLCNLIISPSLFHFQRLHTKLLKGVSHLTCMIRRPQFLRIQDKTNTKSSKHNTGYMGHAIKTLLRAGSRNDAACWTYNLRIYTRGCKWTS